MVNKKKIKLIALDARKLQQLFRVKKKYHDPSSGENRYTVKKIFQLNYGEPPAAKLTGNSRKNTV